MSWSKKKILIECIVQKLEMKDNNYTRTMDKNKNMNKRLRTKYKHAQELTRNNNYLKKL